MSTAIVTQPKNELALAAADSKRKREQTVLEEDDWTQQIEAIIERDFYPDLPKLQSKLEWLQAVQSGNPVLIRQAQMNIAQRRAGLRTPMGAGMTTDPLHGVATSLLRTPAGLATPAATPAYTPSLGLREEPSGDTTQAPLPAASLDAFMARHTSEDNASFAEIMAETAKRRRQNKAWLYEDHNKALALDGPRPVDGFGTSGQPVDGLISWPHVNKNRLYYDTSEFEALPLSEQELAEQVQGKPKQIRHSNTRLPGSATPSTPLPGSSSAAAAPPAPLHEALATPSFTPGMDASPLVTWGALGGTPLRIDDAEDADLARHGDQPGPRFRLSQTPRREQLGRAISQKATASLKRPPVPRFSDAATPSHTTPGNGRKGSSSMKPSLSAAGQRLASSLRGNTPSADVALRASYSHRTSTTPGRTPTQWTPRNDLTPVLRPAAVAHPSAEISRTAVEITDDLLDL